MFRVFLDPDTGASGGGNPTDGGDKKTDDLTTIKFSQADVNRITATHKRQLREEKEQLVQQLETLRQSQTLSEQQREEFESQISNLQKQYLTKEEQARIELDKVTKKNEGLLKQTAEERDRWKKDYSETVIENSLRKAAEEGGAYKTDQIVLLLRTNTQLVEDVGADGKPNGKFVPKVNFQTVDKDGVPVTLMLNPAEAVKAMAESPENYGNLFKANLTGGVGGQQSVGKGSRTSIEKLKDPEFYAKWRKENPDYNLPS